MIGLGVYILEEVLLVEVGQIARLSTGNACDERVFEVRNSWTFGPVTIEVDGLVDHLVDVFLRVEGVVIILNTWLSRHLRSYCIRHRFQVGVLSH